ncbi:hypothetical protein DL96DRAFT_1816604 [Flagelloscypha sp. PMI_526]|nr:hypothetical protein DL96DRAFT_1816604 [Flagelloscypha sp. PMI_526]
MELAQQMFESPVASSFTATWHSQFGGMKATSLPPNSLDNCNNLSTLAVHCFSSDLQRAKPSLPSSLVNLACDLQHFSDIIPQSAVLDSTFQAITHLHLLTQLLITQFWGWIGRAHMPVLTHLAIEHHLQLSLEDASEDLTGVVQEHLHSQILLCLILVLNKDQSLGAFGLNTINLSDGIVDDRVVLGAYSSPQLQTRTGFLLTLCPDDVQHSWRSFPFSTRWARAEDIRKKRRTYGKRPLEYYYPAAGTLPVRRNALLLEGMSKST